MRRASSLWRPNTGFKLGGCNGFAAYGDDSTICWLGGRAARGVRHDHDEDKFFKAKRPEFLIFLRADV